MNYYIQGDAANADKIKAAFEAKGISDGGNSFIHSNYLYFSEGGEVDFCGIGGHIADIIKTHPDYKELELPKLHYDIANFKPFDKVLVRQNDSSTWGISFFGFFSGIYMCCSNVWYEQCIPLNEETKHLIGTTEMCDEQYINW